MLKPSLQSILISFDAVDDQIKIDHLAITSQKPEIPEGTSGPFFNLSIGAVALPALLAACGGGSSGGGSEGGGAPVIRDLDRDFIASIDLRFDHPTDFTTDGVLVNSFANVKRSVDLAKQNGFTAIELDLNVPIDINTGKIKTQTDDQFITDRSLPDDTWKIVQYAESIGLDTSLKLNIVDVTNDNVVTTGSVGPGFDIGIFFDSVTQHQVDLAIQAQASGVDQIVIGGMNFGFDTGYRDEWQNLISGIRNVYTGELSYETYYQRDGVVPWDLVDNIALTFAPDLGAPKYSAADIVPLYLQDMDRSAWGTFNPYERINELSARYQDKDLMIYGVAKSPVQTALNENIPVHEVLYQNNQSQDLSTLDFNLQNTRYDGFFEFFGNYLDDKVSAVQFWQFAPWAESTWIKNPQDSIGEKFNTYARGGYFLNYQPETLDAINDYLQQGWGHNTLDFPDSNDAQVMPMSLMMGPHLSNPNPWGDPALFIA